MIFWIKGLLWLQKSSFRIVEWCEWLKLVLLSIPHVHVHLLFRDPLPDEVHDSFFILAAGRSILQLSIEVINFFGLSRWRRWIGRALLVSSLLGRSLVSITLGRTLILVLIVLWRLLVIHFIVLSN